MNHHIFAAIIFAFLSLFIKAVLSFQYTIWHLKMMINDFVFSYPIQCRHGSFSFIDDFFPFIIPYENSKSNVFLVRISPHTPQTHYRSIDLPIHTDIFSSHDIPAYTENTDPALPDADCSLPLELQKSTHGNCGH